MFIYNLSDRLLQGFSMGKSLSLVCSSKWCVWEDKCICKQMLLLHEKKYTEIHFFIFHFVSRYDVM